MQVHRITCLVASALALSCGGNASPNTKAPSPAPSVTTTRRGVDESSAKITAFAVAPGNLAVDLISMREGAAKPDGNRDLAFTATVFGPVDALYLTSCTDQGEPLHSFVADTIRGAEPLPGELGSALDTGHLTEWIALKENGAFVNHATGRVDLDAGPHTLELYVPNTGMLRAGTHLRLYARLPSGALVAGPVVQY